MNRIRCLLADDHELVRGGLKLMLPDVDSLTLAHATLCKEGCPGLVGRRERLHRRRSFGDG